MNDPAAKAEMIRIRSRSSSPMRFLFVVLLAITSGLYAQSASKTGESRNERSLKAAQVFDLSQPIIFSDDFSSGKMERWNFSENDQYRLASVNPDRIAVVDAPLLAGRKAVRMVVNRAPNSFRSEISLPFEKGFHERWYGERILIPEEWVLDDGKGNDIVMQWHAIPGNGKATYPNLEISVGNDRWFVRQSFGNTLPKPTRTNTRLDEPLKRGVWTSWVTHVKWSPKDEGLMEIWKDGQKVYERTGPNVYGNIGQEYTPYLKTGIYHPEWHTDSERKLTAFNQETPASTKKIIYVTDFKMGSERARYDDIAPAPVK